MTYEIQYISNGWVGFYTIRANSAKHAYMKFKNLFGRDVKVTDIKGQYYYHSCYPFTTTATWCYNSSTTYGL